MPRKICDGDECDGEARESGEGDDESAGKNGESGGGNGGESDGESQRHHLRYQVN